MTRSTAGRHRTARLAAVAGGLAAIVAAGALAGCGTGQVAATSIITSAVPGGSATVPVPDPNNATSAVYFSNVLILPNGLSGYAAGANAPLSVNIANQSAQTVRVTGGAVFAVNQTSGKVGEQIGTIGWSSGPAPVATPSAPPSPTSRGGSPSPAGPPPPSGSQSASGSPSTSGSPSSAPASTPSSSAPAAPDTRPVTLAPAAAVWLSSQNPASPSKFLQIQNLTRQISPGETVAVEFTVAAGNTPLGNGPVRIIVPISTLEASPSPTG